MINANVSFSITSPYFVYFMIILGTNIIIIMGYKFMFAFVILFGFFFFILFLITLQGCNTNIMSHVLFLLKFPYVSIYMVSLHHHVTLSCIQNFIKVTPGGQQTWNFWKPGKVREFYLCKMNIAEVFKIHSSGEQELVTGVRICSFLYVFIY